MNTEFSLSNARNHLADIANNVAFKGKRITVTRNGKRVFAIVPIEDLETIEAIEDQIDLEDARKALKDVKKHGTTSWEAIKKKLKL